MHMTRKAWIILFLTLGILTRFVYWGEPNQVVFDEVHFGKTVNAYTTGEYFFEVHPPLGKLIIAGTAKLFNYEPNLSFDKIGDEYANDSYKYLRLAPMIFGALLPLIVFLLALEIGLSLLPAALAGLAMLLENFYILQSRLILLDIFIVFFGLLSLFWYFRYRKTFSIKHLIYAAIFGGLTISVKWSGLAFPALWILFEAVRIIRESRISFRQALKMVGVGAIMVAIYVSTFAIHFSLLPKSGTGDSFMSSSFNRTLIGNESLDARPLNDFGKFVELNIEMYRAHNRITDSHPYQSSWSSWPFLATPIYYWQDAGHKIYSFGNPMVWWLSTLSIIYLLVNIFIKKFSGLGITLSVILAGFLANLIPFAGIHRTLFIYHYMGAYVFAILALAYVFQENISNKDKKHVFIALGLIFLATFIYFSPLTYGTELTTNQFEDRMWLKSWK